jgi:hypothetical protein
MAVEELIFDNVPLPCNAASVQRCRDQLFTGPRALARQCLQWGRLKAKGHVKGGLQGLLTKKAGFAFKDGEAVIGQHRGSGRVSRLEWKAFNSYTIKGLCDKACGPLCGWKIWYIPELNSKCPTVCVKETPVHRSFCAKTSIPVDEDAMGGLPMRVRSRSCVGFQVEC